MWSIYTVLGDSLLRIYYQDSIGSWKIIHCWSFTIVSWKQTIGNDQHLSGEQDIEWKFSGVKSHKSIGAGEIYYHQIGRIYLKLKTEHPLVDENLSFDNPLKPSMTQQASQAFPLPF